MVSDRVQGSGTPREQGRLGGSLRPPAGLRIWSPALPTHGETTLLSVAGTGPCSFSFFSFWISLLLCKGDKYCAQEFHNIPYTYFN